MEITGACPPRYGNKTPPPRTVGRGPVPRHASRNPTIAGDRPPRYEKKRLPRATQRSRGTGPRATVKKTVSCNDRGGEAPRYDEKTPPSPLQRSRGTGPRATVKRRSPATIAGETRSDARVASEGPRATKKNVPLLLRNFPENNKEPLDIYIHLWYPIDIWKMQSQRIPQH